MTNSIKSLYVEVLTVCNERCSYCYNYESVTHTQQLMDIKLFKKIVDNARESNILSLTISGGEPMLHSGLCEMIEYIYDSGIHPSLITNLTLYDEKVYQLITRLAVPLQVTLDGHNSDTHDFTRGIDTFTKIASNLKRLSLMNYRGELTVRMNIHMKNYQDISDTVLYAKEIGASNVTLALLMYSGVGTNFNLLISEENERLYEALSAEYEHLQENNSLPRLKIEGLFPSMGCPYYGDNDLNCGFRISTDGLVYPCQLFLNKIFSLGDIASESLINIANGSKMRRFRDMLNLRKFYISQCYACVYKKMCKTGCPAVAYNKTSNLFTNSGVCARLKNAFNNEIAKKLLEKQI